MTRAVADARMTYQYNFLDNLATKTKSNAKGDVAPVTTTEATAGAESSMSVITHSGKCRRRTRSAAKRLGTDPSSENSPTIVRPFRAAYARAVSRCASIRDPKLPAPR